MYVFSLYKVSASPGPTHAWTWCCIDRFDGALASEKMVRYNTQGPSSETVETQTWGSVPISTAPLRKPLRPASRLALCSIYITLAVSEQDGPGLDAVCEGAMVGRELVVAVGAL